MESRKQNFFPAYLRSETDDLTEDLAKSLPDDEAAEDEESNTGEPASTDEEDQKSSWQHKLREEMGALHEEEIHREEKDITD